MRGVCVKLVETWLNRSQKSFSLVPAILVGFQEIERNANSWLHFQGEGHTKIRIERRVVQESNREGQIFFFSSLDHKQTKQSTSVQTVSSKKNFQYRPSTKSKKLVLR